MSKTFTVKSKHFTNQVVCNKNQNLNIFCSTSLDASPLDHSSITFFHFCLIVKICVTLCKIVPLNVTLCHFVSYFPTFYKYICVQLAKLQFMVWAPWALGSGLLGSGLPGLWAPGLWAPGLWALGKTSWAPEITGLPGPPNRNLLSVFEAVKDLLNRKQI